MQHMSVHGLAFDLFLKAVDAKQIETLALEANDFNVVAGNVNECGLNDPTDDDYCVIYHQEEIHLILHIYNIVIFDIMTGAGASNTTAGSVSAPPTAISDEQKPLDGGEAPQETQSGLPEALQTQKFTVSKEEAAELNTQVKAIKMKGALSMWKNKTLV